VKNDEINFNESILSVLLSSLENHPERPALKVNECIYSYNELFTIASNLAAQIQIHPDKRCVILCDRNQYAYFSLLAALLAGKAYVFLNSKDSLARLSWAFEKIDSSLLLVDKAHLIRAKKVVLKSQKPTQVIEVESLDLNCEVNSYCRPLWVYRYAYIMFTSGTSGSPKGIPISHANLRAYIKNIGEASQPSHKDIISQLSELSFDFSVHDVFLAWTSGACLSVFSDISIFSLPQFLCENQISYLAAVPSTIRLLDQINRSGKIFPTIRYTAFCGEVLTDEIARKWNSQAPNSRIDNLYGPTEATVAFMLYTWSQAYCDNVVSIGKAFPDQEIFVLNSEGLICRPEETGEVYVAGSQVADEYWRAPDLTRDSFCQIYSNTQRKIVSLYKTGDLGFYDKNGDLHNKGRGDDQNTRRGYRIEKMEIESEIRKIAKTELVALVPGASHLGNTMDYLTCYIVGSPFCSERIIKQCRQELPDYMVPNRVVELPHFPYNKNGKVDYQQLKLLSLEN
jgi:D-alanine--poly(phosphoribitol) ligase subunit 1